MTGTDSSDEDTTGQAATAGTESTTAVETTVAATTSTDGTGLDSTGDRPGEVSPGLVFVAFRNLARR